MGSRSRLRRANSSKSTNHKHSNNKKKTTMAAKTKRPEGGGGGVSDNSIPSNSSNNKKTLVQTTTTNTMTTASVKSKESCSSSKECEQCGSCLYLEGVGKVSKALPHRINGQEHCLVCDYVAFRKLQRECVHCEKPNCEFFCEWCGNAFHTKCARIMKENINNPHGFCCHKCEEQELEDGGQAGDQEQVAKCGQCTLPFHKSCSTSDQDDDEEEDSQEFYVNQAVLVETDDVLYNAVITEVDNVKEKIKIHFLRWSKTFDNWYAMDNERINESLACDCCNEWFHIGCLPPIKSSGRYKDTTYVCPSCIDQAKDYHNGQRIVLKSKRRKRQQQTASASTSAAVAATVATDQRQKKKEETVLRQKEEEEEEETPVKKHKKICSVSTEQCLIDDDEEEEETITTTTTTITTATTTTTIKEEGHPSSEPQEFVLYRRSSSSGRSSMKNSLSSLLNSPQMDPSPGPFQPHAIVLSSSCNGSYSSPSRRVLDLDLDEEEDDEDAIQIKKEATASTTEAEEKTDTESPSLSAFDILREVAAQSITDDKDLLLLPKGEKRKEPHHHNHHQQQERGVGPGFFKKTKLDSTTSTSKLISALNGSFVDMHFAIRKEMYLKFCFLEEQGLLAYEQAQLLRTLIYPTSERFHDLKFVYLVNQDLPPTQLIKHLLELARSTSTNKKTTARETTSLQMDTRTA